MSRKQTLIHYGKVSMELAQLLKDGPLLTAEQHLFIENSLLAVQLALASQRISSRKPVSRQRG